MSRVTWNLGLRYDWFIGETQESEVSPSRFNTDLSVRQVSGRQERLESGLCRRGAGLEGHLAARWRGDRPLRRWAHSAQGQRRRYVAGQQIAVANAANPVTVLGLTDTRPWTDLDGNGLPLDANGNIQFNELAASTSTPTFGRETSRRRQPIRGAERLAQARLQPGILGRGSASTGRSDVGERRLLSPHVRQSDVHRRPALRRQQLRLVLPHGAGRSRPAGGGGYQVCGVMDLKAGGVRAHSRPTT